MSRYLCAFREVFPLSAIVTLGDDFWSGDTPKRTPNFSAPFLMHSPDLSLEAVTGFGSKALQGTRWPL